MKGSFLYQLSEPFCSRLWTSLVLIMQIMPERIGKLLLIILCLLPCSVASFECSISAEEDLPSLTCPSFYQNASKRFSIGSAECRSVLSNAMCPTYRFGPGLDALVFIIVDLAPLIVYLPALIIFNINLASVPAQSFLFFYHALSAVVDSDLLIGLSAVGSNHSGLLWGLLVMQSPINNVVFPRTLPYITLQYCKLAALCWWP